VALKRFVADFNARDVRYAVRLLRKAPGFTATALATLALCLGAVLTIFAVVDSVLLRPLPFPAAGRLVSVYNTYPKAAVPNDGCSLTNYYERRGRIAAFAGIAAYRDGTAIAGEPGSTERVDVTRVSPDFFATLGLGPAIGRAFTEEETTYQTDDVAILTDGYWRERLGGNSGVVGRTIRLNGVETTVIGILPRQFSFLSSRARIYLPLASNPDERSPRQRHSGNSDMIARVAPHATIGEAQSQVDAHNASIEQDSPEARMMRDAGFRSIVVPLHADHVAAIRPTLLLLQAGVLVLLLIGAVNVTNLLLIRANGRVKELAVRQALGASRRHIVTEVMVETIVLTVAGGLLGLAVGASGIRLLAVLGAEHLPLGARISFDVRVAVAAMIAAIVLGAAIAVPIAWYSLRGQMLGALQSESRGGTAGPTARRLRHGFLVAQMALAFVLLAGAGLLGLSLKKVMAVSPGFQATNILSAQLTLPGKSYADRASLFAFTERLAGELGRQPGVVATGMVTNVPLSGISNKSAAKVKGYTLGPGESPRGRYSYSVGGDYFAAMGFSLREGRWLSADDSRRAARVCVVDEDFARYYWPRGGAIGQRLFEGAEDRPDADAFTIVGVVGAVKQAELAEHQAQGAVYYPFGQRPDNSLFVVVRTSLPPESLGFSLQRAVRAIDAELPVNDLRSMETRIANSLVARRSPALLAGLFSIIALLLTAIGTYGVLTYAVSQRRREIGLRMALGARPAQVRRQFMSLALRLLAAGTSLGVLGAWLTGQAIQSMLFEMPALHVATIVGTAVVLAVVSIAACLLPSHRAAHISPMEALSD
jgi:predicted permease